MFGQSRSTKNKIHLVFKRINGINNKVVFLHVETICCLCLIDFLQAYNIGIRVDFQQSVTQRLHLHLAESFAGCHQLTVTIGDADAVGVNKGEIP